MSSDADSDAATRAVSEAPTAKTTTGAKRGTRGRTGSRRPRLTAVDYVARMDLPQVVRAPLIELASRFDERSFLPTIGDVRNFLLFCDYDGTTPKSRAAAVPCAFKLLARMDPARVAGICDERMFSGPANMLPIADAIGHASSGIQPSTIEIHIEMLLASAGDEDGLRQLLLDHATQPWSHGRVRSAQLGANTGRETLVFRRWPDDKVPESELVLNALDAGYRLSNIVPVVHGDRRSVGEWNAVLEDFIEHVVVPAVATARHNLTVGPRRVSMRDLTSVEAERALRRFSSAANRSTGSSHPLDERRWMDFVIACAQATRRQDRPPLSPTLDGALLKRWLTEVDGWTTDIASDLVELYEFGFHLIQLYNQNH